MFKSEDLPAATDGATLSRGLGRSYGDSSLPAGPDLPVADTTWADRLLSFDPASGILRAEAGVSLFALNRIFLRRGWFVPVSPGTQFVTLGGMVASDVHGKNHHVDGCFGQHVRRLKLRVADGRIVECSDARRAGTVPRHDRRHGPDGPHPRSRVSDAARSPRRGFGARASGSTTSTR